LLGTLKGGTYISDKPDFSTPRDDRLTVREFLDNLYNQKIVDERLWAGQTARNYKPPGMGRGLVILGPTRAWAVDLAAICGVHPQERGVRIATYEDRGALIGINPAGLIMAVPDRFELHLDQRDQLRYILMDLARRNR
jgi:hypothetical protein